MELSLPTPRRASAVLGFAILLLAAAYAVSRALWHAKGFDLDIYPMRLVDLNGEGNLPAMFSALLLLSVSAVLACIASAAPGQDRRAWGVLSAGFLFLTFDEFLGFHERVSHVMRWLGVGGHGATHFAWVIPYGLISVALGALYVPFLLRLPRRTAALSVLAGATYLGGAVGCEMISGELVEAYGRESRAMTLEILVEETLEMSGAAQFLVTLLAYWRDALPQLRVVVSPPVPR